MIVVRSEHRTAPTFLDRQHFGFGLPIALGTVAGHQTQLPRELRGDFRVGHSGKSLTSRSSVIPVASDSLRSARILGSRLPDM